MLSRRTWVSPATYQALAEDSSPVKKQPVLKKLH